MVYSKRPTLTTGTGMPVRGNHGPLTDGQRGPLPMQDWHVFERHAIIEMWTEITEIDSDYMRP